MRGQREQKAKVRVRHKPLIDSEGSGAGGWGEMPGSDLRLKRIPWLLSRGDSRGQE